MTNETLINRKNNYFYKKFINFFEKFVILHPELTFKKLKP